MTTKPISRLRKCKADIRKHYGVDHLVQKFDSGWFPGKGDPSLYFRTVIFRHPSNKRKEVVCSLADDGSARVFAANDPDWYGR